MLLLRQDGERFELLLNLRTPLRLSQLADWDTLLLPAFTSVHALIQRFLDDFSCQEREAASDEGNARGISELLDGLGERVERELLRNEDSWMNKINYVANRKFVKFSPRRRTDGIRLYVDHFAVAGID